MEFVKVITTIEIRCAIVLFILSIKSFVMLTVIKSETLRINRDDEWSVFENGPEFEMNRNWNAFFCHTIKRPTAVFLEVYVTNRSHETQNFFNIFASYFHNSQPRCINAIISSSFVMEHGETEDINWPWLLKSDDFLYDRTSSTSIPQVESFVFNNPIMARVMIMPLTKIDFIIKYVFDHWNHRQYVVMFIILHEKQEVTDMHIKNIGRTFISITRKILETLWEKHGVYNVFIGFPLLDNPGTKLWSYDPFSRDDITQRPGRIVEVDLLMPPNAKRLHNLQGYKLNIGLFEAKLTAEIQSAKFYSDNHRLVIEDFHGVDGYMVQTMSKHFNFTVDIIPPSGGVKYGHVQNGIAVGTLGDVAYRRIHASFNSQYVKDYIIGNQQFAALLNIEFTAPVDWDSVCIIVPSPEEIPRWLRTFIYMQPAIWLCLLIAIILATIAWHLLRNYHHSASRNYSKCDKNYLAVFIDTFMLLVGAPVRSTSILGERILVGALALLGLTVMGAFTGTLYQSFTHDMFYRPIETLKQLDDSGLLVATSSPNLEDIFGPKGPINKSCTCSRLAHKMKSLPRNVSAIKLTAYDRHIAAISREKVFQIEQHQYTDSKGRSLLHLVPDCPQAYYLAYLMPANSIFLESFNSVITALNEGGVTLFWNKNEIQKSIYDKISSATNDKQDKVSDGPKPFSIKDMEICFLILAFGLVLSVIVFIIEWINIVQLRRLVVSECRISTQICGHY